MIPNKLHEFYREWYEAADGTIETTWFSPSSGLCDNLQRYSQARGWSVDTCATLMHSMRNQFIAKGLDRMYPFNGGNHTAYRIEYFNRNMHKNEKRLAFVRGELLKAVLR